MDCDQVISALKKLEDKDKVAFKEKKFGIVANNSLGIYHKDLKLIADEIKKDSKLAVELFETGIYEARILCSKIFKVNDLTIELMEKWVSTFENWEVCDSFCMGLFAKSRFAVIKAKDWTCREKEFEKRAGFTIIASYCMADKKASNEIFIEFLSIIKREANDERIYVKKAVNWALRSIGKRNIDLQRKAIETAHEIKSMGTKSSFWIATDALKELQGEKVNVLDYPRDIYRK